MNVSEDATTDVLLKACFMLFFLLQQTHYSMLDHLEWRPASGENNFWVILVLYKFAQDFQVYSPVQNNIILFITFINVIYGDSLLELGVLNKSVLHPFFDVSYSQ